MIMTLKNGRGQPCNGCPDRYPACSDHCQKQEFLHWKEQQALIRKNREDYYRTIDYTVEAIRKSRRRCR